MFDLLISGNKTGQTVCDVLRSEGLNAKFIPSPFPLRKRAFLHPASVLGGLLNARLSDVVLAESLTGGWEVAHYARVVGVPYILHFTGTDVFLYRESDGAKRTLWDRTVRNASIVLAQTKELADTLREMGCNCGVWESPFDYHMFRWQESRYPAWDYLCYVPEPEIYRLKDLLKFVEERPGSIFTVLGDLTERDFLRHPNVRRRPLVKSSRELREVYLQHRTLLRLTTHDGSPFMVREAVALGLGVYWKIADNEPRILGGSKLESDNAIESARKSVDELEAHLREVKGK